MPLRILSLLYIARLVMIAIIRCLRECLKSIAIRTGFCDAVIGNIIFAIDRLKK